MSNSTKITLSLPRELLLDVERERQASGETRSEFFRRAVGELPRREGDRETIEQYIQGYLKYPETPGELGWLETASQEVLAEYPWDDEVRE